MSEPVTIEAYTDGALHILRLSRQVDATTKRSVDIVLPEVLVNSVMAGVTILDRPG